MKELMNYPIFLDRYLLDQLVLFHVQKNKKALLDLIHERYTILFKDISNFIQHLSKAINDDTDKQKKLIKFVYEDYQQLYIKQKEGYSHVDLANTFYETQKEVNHLINRYNDNQEAAENFMLDLYQIKNCFLAFEKYLTLDSTDYSHQICLQVFQYQNLLSELEKLNEHMISICHNIIYDQLAIVNEINSIKKIHHFPDSSN